MSNKVISELDLISQNNLSTSDSIVVNDASDENRIKRTTIEELSAIMTGSGTFSWDVRGDSGVPETVTQSSTVTIHGGAGGAIHTVIGTGDTVQILANSDVLATRSHVDGLLLGNLNNVTVSTTPADNRLLAYDSATSQWTDQTAVDAGLTPVSGSVALSTVGIITNGTWQATAVSSQYGGTGQDFSTKTGILSYNSGTANVASGPHITHVLDEDDLTSNSATALVTQQSVKAYIDSKYNQTFTVTVADDGGGSQNVFVIDGNKLKTNLHARFPLHLQKGFNYRFDQSDASNANQLLKFSTTIDGTHQGGTEYTTGVNYNGTPGSAHAYTEIKIAQDAPDILYIYSGGTSATGYGGSAGGSSDDQRTPIYTTDRDGWIPINGNRTATKGDKLLVDCSASAVIVTLPASASAGDTVRIVDITGSASTNNISVERGNHKIMGVTENLAVTTNRAGFELVYADSNNGWVLTEN